jgi:hypothetical protein
VDKQRQKYQGLLDMIDGGGAGAVGNEFEGGGLLSMIANAIATPYGSEDRMRDAMRGQRPVSRSAAMDSIETLSSQNLQNDLSPFGGVGPNISGPAAERGMGLGPFGGAGDNVSGAAAERGMGLDPFGGPGDFNPANAAPVQIASVGDNTGFGSSLQGLGQSPNYSAPKDPYIVQNPPNNLPNAPQQDALPDMTPSLGEFVEFLNRHYDPDFVRRVTLDSDQFNNAYRLFVNNGGKLTP